MLRKTLIFILSLLSVYVVRAEGVALVLSGGGAKGLYHIGVLQALEENEVAIDYVAGPCRLIASSPLKTGGSRKTR